MEKDKSKGNDKEMKQEGKKDSSDSEEEGSPKKGRSSGSGHKSQK